MAETSTSDDPLPAGTAKGEAGGEDEDLYDPGRNGPPPGAWFRWPRQMYYRYKLMTGVYMLGPAEEVILHFFFFLGAYFSITYGMQFYSEYRGWLPSLV
jgi:hypothetical protein